MGSEAAASNLLWRFAAELHFRFDDDKQMIAKSKPVNLGFVMSSNSLNFVLLMSYSLHFIQCVFPFKIYVIWTEN